MANERTIVSVHGYAGDADQVRLIMPYYRHHQCPVYIVSPVDFPLDLRKVPGMGLKYIYAGKRAYTGQLSLDRQKLQMQELLKLKGYDYFLMNDSDSVCLSPELPRYLYDEDVLWSNVVSDEMHIRTDPKYPWPRLAFQPPYFCSRKILEGLVEVADSIPADPQTPFIDWCMMAWAVGGKVPWKNFPTTQGVSCPTRNYEPGKKLMGDMIRYHGAVMLHSIKTMDALQVAAWSRVEWKRAHRHLLHRGHS